MKLLSNKNALLIVALLGLQQASIANPVSYLSREVTERIDHTAYDPTWVGELDLHLRGRADQAGKKPIKVDPSTGKPDKKPPTGPAKPAAAPNPPNSPSKSAQAPPAGAPPAPPPPPPLPQRLSPAPIIRPQTRPRPPPVPANPAGNPANVPGRPSGPNPLAPVAFQPLTVPHLKGDPKDTTTDFTQMERNGRTAFKAYEDARTQNIPDAVVGLNPPDEDVAKRRAFYSIIGNQYISIKPAPKVKTEFRSFRDFSPEDLVGLDPRNPGEATLISIKSKTAEATGSDEVILQCYYDPNGRFLIRSNAFSQQDTDTPEAKKIPVSEMNLQAFIHTAQKNAANIQAIFLKDIRNFGFVNVLNENCRQSGRDPRKKQVWTARDDASFFRLIGTQNIRGTILSLKSHRNALGNKPISKIITSYGNEEVQALIVLQQPAP